MDLKHHCIKMMKVEQDIFDYRQKLRTQTCLTHTSNLRSRCAKCRSLFYEECIRQMENRPKPEAIGLNNQIKSECGNGTRQ